LGHRLEQPRRPLSDSLDTKWEPGDAAWWRIYHLDWQNPDALHRRSNGPWSRFDHHRRSPAGDPQYDPDGRAVTYLGQDMATVASEVFWDPAESDPIALICPRHWIAQVATAATVQLVDLVSEGGFDAIGAPPELSTGASDQYTITQEWARAVYEDLGMPGIKYPGAHSLGPCMVLFETAPPLTVVHDDGDALDLPVQDPRVWDRFRKACKGKNKRRVVQKISSTECPSCNRLGLAPMDPIH
jgi:RES domain